MNRFTLMAVVLLLATGGTATAAEKEAVDWPARAAMVKVGMTRAEVEKILPRWVPVPYSSEPYSIERYVENCRKNPSIYTEVSNTVGSISFKVSTNALGTNTLILRGEPSSYFGGVVLGTGAGFSECEKYLVAEGWMVTVVYEDKGKETPYTFVNGMLVISKDWERNRAKSRLAAPVKIEKLK